MSSPLNQVLTDHSVVPIGQDLMELRDNSDGAVIAQARRTGVGQPWVITIARDTEFTDSQTGRQQAYMSMINNGPAGVAEGTAGYSTTITPGLDQLP